MISGFDFRRYIQLLYTVYYQISAKGSKREVTSFNYSLSKVDFAWSNDSLSSPLADEN